MPDVMPKAPPELSIIVIVYNMQREAPRTLYSLSAEYQRGVGPDDYEVIVVDNGSSEPLSAADVEKHGPNFKYFYLKDSSPSPAEAINFGVSQSRARDVGIMIDGARIASPRVVRMALMGLRRFIRPIVGTIGFHLGPDMQTRTPRHGYNKEVEDALLESIRWKQNGYRLFEISALAGSSAGGWYGGISESNLVFMPRALYDELGGYEERFDYPGGGLVNLDFYRRACALPNSQLITLYGEATFHQIHGGIMTNRPHEDVLNEFQRYNKEYEEIRGEPFSNPNRQPLLLGFHDPSVLKVMKEASSMAVQSNVERYLPHPALLPRSDAMPAKEGADEPATTDAHAGSAGDDKNHRAYVGPEDGWDRVAASQFNLLTMLGLRQHHKLLDLGCGALRAGRLFIPYLNTGCYHGIEPEEWLVEAGITKELGTQMADIKKPKFSHNSDFDLTVFNTSFDYVLAQSVFSHTGISQLRSTLQSARLALRPDGLLIANYWDTSKNTGQDEWAYPGCNTFNWATISSACAHFRMHCRKIDWPHSALTWFVASVDLETLERRLQDGGIDVLPDELSISGWIKQRRLAGKEPAFYLRGNNPPL